MENKSIAMSIPKVAVLITTYNRKNLLKRTLNSLQENIKNSNFDVTLMIVDDASTDGASDWLLKQKLNLNAPIKFGVYIGTKNMGLGYRLNESLNSLFQGDFDFISYNQDDVEFKEGWLQLCIDAWNAAKKGNMKVGFITCHDAPEHPEVEHGHSDYLHKFKKTCRATHLFASVERWKKFGEIPELTPGVAAPKPGQGSLVDWWLVGHPEGKYPESEHSIKKDGEFVLVIPGYVKHIGVSESTWGNYFNPELE